MQLKGIASRLVTQENNLNHDEPVLYKAMTYDIEGAVGFQDDLIGIPGCPLLVVGHKVAAFYSQASPSSSEASETDSNSSQSLSEPSSFSESLSDLEHFQPTPPARIMCFDYYRGKSICSVDCPGRLYKISKPHHQRGKCIMAVQIGIGTGLEYISSLLSLFAH